MPLLFRLIRDSNTITNIGSFHHQGMANIVEAHLLEKMNLVVPSKPANPKSVFFI